MEFKICFAACLLVSGCLAEDSMQVAERDEALIYGAGVNTNPEVGELWMGTVPCTASLIGKRAIITGAHCFQYESGDAPTGGWPFMFKNGASMRFVTSYVSIGTTASTSYDDLAVAALDSEVNPETENIIWLSLASRLPTSGSDRVLELGYGCGDYQFTSEGFAQCNATSDFSVKRGIELPWSVFAGDLQVQSSETGQLQQGVEGDSGGPVIHNDYIVSTLSRTTIEAHDPSGQVSATSTWYTDIPSNLARIDAALAQLGVSRD